MSKEKSRQTGPVNPAFLRRGEHSVTGLKENAAALRRYAAELDAFVASAESLGLESMVLDGTTKFDRAVVLVKDFLRSIEYALIKAKYRNG